MGTGGATLPKRRESRPGVRSAGGALIVEWAKHDGSDRTGPVDVPPGACRWTEFIPVAPFAGTRKTWVLSSASQLRPGPPPDCRSPEGQAELAEVRNYPRTFESNALNALGNEAGESRLWAGIHFRSDIDTGLALGRAVAKLVIERAEKDGSQ